MKKGSILKSWFVTKSELAELAVAAHKGVSESFHKLFTLATERWGLKSYQFCSKTQNLYLYYKTVLTGKIKRNYLFKASLTSLSGKINLVSMGEIKGVLNPKNFKNFDFQEFDSEHLLVQNQFDGLSPKTVFSTLSKTTHELRPLGTLQTEDFDALVQLFKGPSILEFYKLSTSSVLIVMKYGAYIYNFQSSEMITTKDFLEILVDSPEA